MDESKPIGVIKKLLRYFNTTGSRVTEKTVPKNILSAKDGIERANSRDMLKSLVGWALRMNECEDVN